MCRSYRNDIAAS